jgi:hypothetical protein
MIASVTGCFSLHSKDALNKIYRGEGVFFVEKTPSLFPSKTRSPLKNTFGRLLSEAKNSPLFI